MGARTAFRGRAAAGDAALLAAVALAAVAVQLPLLDRGLGLGDEGIVLTLADAVGRGRVLYRDVRADGVFPGAPHLLAAWFGVAGTSVLASRVLGAAAFAALAVALVAVARTRLGRRAAAVLAAAIVAWSVVAFPTWQVPAGAPLAAAAGAVAAALLVGDGRAAAAGAGALVGGALLAHPAWGGATGLAAAAIALARGVARPFLGGAVVPVAAALGAFAAAGALEPLRAQVGGAPFAAPVAARVPPPVALAGPFALLAAALVADAAARRLPRALAIAAGATAVVAAGVLAWEAARVARDVRRTFDRPLAAPRAGVRVDARRAAVLDDVVEWIAGETAPAAPVPVWPAAPALGFLAGRGVVGGFPVVAGRDERLVAALDRRRVDAVVWELGTERRVREDFPALYTHLVRRYRIAAVFAPDPAGPMFLALRRRPIHPPLGASVLTHLPRQGRRWPFSEVLAVPVGRPESPAVVATAMPFPHVRPRIEFGYGVNPERWRDLPRGPFTFEVWVEGERAWSATLDPATRAADRRWIPGAVDLARFAGNPLGDFAFRVTAPEPPSAPDDVAGFEDPRITGE